MPACAIPDHHGFLSELTQRDTVLVRDEGMVKKKRVKKD